MRNQISAELMEILANTEEYLLQGYRNFAVNAYKQDVENLLVTISSSPDKRINGISELESGKDWSNLERFANDKFTLESVDTKSFMNCIECINRVKDWIEYCDLSIDETQKVFLLLLRGYSDLRIVRKTNLNKVTKLTGQSNVDVWDRFTVISRGISIISYMHSYLEKIYGVPSQELSDVFKSYFVTVEHSSKEAINEFKDLLLLIKTALHENDSDTRFNIKRMAFEVGTMEDFIARLEDLFSDDLRVEDKTAYTILNMINNSIADIDRTLDNLPIGHDSNRHTLKVKRSALMDLCIDIEKSYTSI